LLTRQTLFAQVSLGAAAIVASVGLTALAKGRGNDPKLRHRRDRRHDRKERRRGRRRK
jgi:hypothetical protein